MYLGILKRSSAWIVGLVLAAALITIPSARGAAIYGSLTFYGAATTGGPLATSMAFTGYTGPDGTGLPLVLGGTQDGLYVGVPDDTPVTFNAFAFNPTPAFPFALWTFDVGGTVYSFQVTSLIVAQQDSTFLNIHGDGIAHIDGMTDTAATWTITAGPSGQIVTFGTGLTVVPEPATSALLILFGAGAVMWGRRSSGTRSKEGG